MDKREIQLIVSDMLSDRYFSEVLAGAKNSSNLVFRTSFRFYERTLLIFKNGLFLIPSKDYTVIDDSTVKLAVAPVSTDSLAGTYLRIG